METQDKPCRHQYVKIFQRRYKGLGRRMVSTRGYLPVGFTAKDFSHLSLGSYCFCSTCRMRLFPVRIDSSRFTRIEEKIHTQAPVLGDILVENSAEIDPIWPEDIAIETKSAENSDVVNVEELQVESVDFGEIADNQVIVNQEIDAEQEEEE